MSFVDAVLIAAVAGRPVRFLMFRGFFGVPLLGWFARRMDAIPVSSRDSQEDKEAALGQAVEAARSGELVCIFAEGAITRSGHTMPFRTGLERIARERAVSRCCPSRSTACGAASSLTHGGRAFTKLPRRFPYKVDIAIGEPLSPDVDAFEVRQRIQEQIAVLRTERRGAGGHSHGASCKEARATRATPRSSAGQASP